MDMLVKLYELCNWSDVRQKVEAGGVRIRRPLAPEKNAIGAWVREHFNDYWQSEFEVSFSKFPVTSFVALREGTIVGFACYDVTKRGFFGPTGVLEKERGQSIGKALLFYCLQAMWEEGYGYAVIGGAGPEEFYEKCVGAVRIDGSAPGIYKGIL